MCRSECSRDHPSEHSGTDLILHDLPGLVQQGVCLQQGLCRVHLEILCHSVKVIKPARRVAVVHSVSCCRRQAIPQRGALWQAALQAQLKAGVMTWSPIVRCCVKTCMTAIVPAIQATSLTTRTEPSGRPQPALAPAGDPPAAGHASMCISAVCPAASVQAPAPPVAGRALRAQCASLPALLHVYRLQLLPLLGSLVIMVSKTAAVSARPLTMALQGQDCAEGCSRMHSTPPSTACHPPVALAQQPDTALQQDACPGGSQHLAGCLLVHGAQQQQRSCSWPLMDALLSTSTWC